ncbi:MAG TPA: N-acetylmuramoyl-L-alanine amidase [Candidatus Omnitrophota bacterium]|nr:N-acetylmuramoyl-L-alanine amidase [Candidatus Omnitrophota bacterium]
MKNIICALGRFQPKIFLIMGAVLLLNGCSSVPPAPTRGFLLKNAAQLRGIEMDYDQLTGRVVLQRAGQKAHAFIGNNRAWIGEEEVLLTEPLYQSGHDIIVPDDFKEKVLNRMSGFVYGQQSHDRLVVVIDPGHGGKDPGARGRSGLKEKDVVLDIAKRLHRKLKKEGWDVHLTRDKDVFISLEQRTEKASELRADLYVSIHANASETPRVNGFEVWTVRPLESQDRKEPQRRRNHDIFFKRVEMEQNNSKLERVVDDLMYAYKRGESSVLAEQVTREVPKDLKLENRGARDSGFFVLRNTLCPAILVEVAFMSNAKEERLLKSEDFRQQVAESLSRAIVRYVNAL